MLSHVKLLNVLKIISMKFHAHYIILVLSNAIFSDVYIYQHKPIFFLMTKAAFWTKAQSLVLFILGQCPRFLAVSSLTLA